jgi:hypothetical protein
MTIFFSVAVPGVKKAPDPVCLPENGSIRILIQDAQNLV